MPRLCLESQPRRPNTMGSCTFSIWNRKPTQTWSKKSALRRLHAAPCRNKHDIRQRTHLPYQALSWNDILSLFSELILNLSDAQPILLPRLTITQASNSTRTLVWIILNHSYGRVLQAWAGTVLLLFITSVTPWSTPAKTACYHKFDHY